MTRFTNRICVRREFIRGGALLASAAAAGAATSLTGASFAAEAVKPPVPENKPASAAPEVTTLEDLMREHGALRRILLIFENVATRASKAQEFPAGVLTQATDIVRRFVEDYHEKLEEDYLFPRFEKAGKLADLAKLLKTQHDAGRRLTDRIKSYLGGKEKEAGQSKLLTRDLRQFARMYRPHAAREDTILFPAFHTIVTAKEYDELGDKFEDKETELFGEGGFEKVVAQIGEMETSLGINDLAQFTPKI